MKNELASYRHLRIVSSFAIAILFVLLITLSFIFYKNMIGSVINGGELNQALINKNEVETDFSFLEEHPQSTLTVADLNAIEQNKENEDVVNIVFIGVDRRSSKETSSRSDALLIATLDNVNKKVKLTSILRDLYVAIPGHRKNRINAACAFGGADLLLQTLNENFKLSVDHYVLVDFESMSDVIDVVGGIEVEMSATEIEEANRVIRNVNYEMGRDYLADVIEAEPGTVHLNGHQAALGYARIRKTDSDVQRSNRQQILLNQLFVKIKAKDYATQIDALTRIVQHVETNISEDRIFNLAMQALECSGEIEKFRIPVEGTYKNQKVDGMDVFTSDLKANTQLLHQFIYNE